MTPSVAPRSSRRTGQHEGRGGIVPAAWEALGHLCTVSLSPSHGSVTCLVPGRARHVGLRTDPLSYLPPRALFPPGVVSTHGPAQFSNRSGRPLPGVRAGSPHHDEEQGTRSGLSSRASCSALPVGEAARGPPGELSTVSAGKRGRILAPQTLANPRRPAGVGERADPAATGLGRGAHPVY